jgi:hypothetical protein
LHDTVTVGAEPRYIAYTPAPATATPTVTVTPTQTLTPAPTNTPVPGATATLTPTPAPICTPRPPVTVSVTPSGADRLQVTVTVAGQNNRILALQFGAVANGRVDVAGQTGLGENVSVTLPTPTTQATFTVRRVSAGAVTVPLTVIDGCGAWQTFVGGGTSAF